MRIVNKRKFITRITELIILLATIVIMPIAINSANQIRGYIATGGEYIIPILSLSLMLVIETIYEERGEEKC